MMRAASVPGIHRHTYEAYRAAHVMLLGGPRCAVIRSPKGEIRIRKPHVADASSLSQVVTSAWQVGFNGILPREFLDQIDTAASYARWMIDLDPARVGPPYFLIAEEEEHAVAFSAFGPGRDEDAPSHMGEVFAIHVAPIRWGKGVGSALLSATITELRSFGLTGAYLWVMDRNSRARRFYDRLGWRFDGAERDSSRFGQISIHEVRYRLNLA